tara:strand:+ start:65319 stop:65780 length:462 start_codon:yes stop_codon:yes gene_type:complete
VKRNPNEIVRAAGIVLVTRQSSPSFLLMHHPPNKKFPQGRWDLPKGHAENDETFLETALREAEEETGISPDDITVDPEFQFELTYPVTYKKTGDQVFTKQVRYFLGYVDSPRELVLTEHESAEWFPWDPPHDIQEETVNPLLTALHEYLSGES